MHHLTQTVTNLYQHASTTLQSGVQAVQNNRVLSNVTRLIGQARTNIHNSPLYQRSCRVVDNAWTFVKQHPVAFITAVGLVGGLALGVATLGASLPLTSALSALGWAEETVLVLLLCAQGVNSLATAGIGALAGHGMDRVITGDKYDHDHSISGFLKRNAHTLSMATLGAIAAPACTMFGALGAMTAVDACLVRTAGALAIVAAVNALPAGMLGALGGYMNAPQ